MNSKCEGPWGLQTVLQSQIQQYTALRCHPQSSPLSWHREWQKKPGSSTVPSASLLVEDAGTGIPAAASTEHLTYCSPSTKPGPLDLQGSCREHKAEGSALPSCPYCLPVEKDEPEAKSSTQGQKSPGSPLMRRSWESHSHSLPEQDKKFSCFCMKILYEN